MIAKKVINELERYRSYVVYSVKASLKAEVAGSYLNWVWWILEPFCLMLIYATIFGAFFQSSELFYPIFIFIGNMMWGFFSKTMASSVSLIKQNQTLITKIYLPKYILLLVEIGINVFKMMLNFVLVIAMLFLFDVPISVNIFFAIPVIFTLVIISFAFGCLLMNFGVYLEDLTYIVSIGLNMLMFFSGVFYNVETQLKFPLNFIAGKLNPVAFLMTAMRECVIYTKIPDLRFLIMWLLVGCVLSVYGIKLLYKNENNYVKMI